MCRFLRSQSDGASGACAAVKTIRLQSWPADTDPDSVTRPTPVHYAVVHAAVCMWSSLYRVRAYGGCVAPVLHNAAQHIVVFFCHQFSNLTGNLIIQKKPEKF